MERSREYSVQRTEPDASVVTLNLFWQFSRQAQMEQNFLSLPTSAPRKQPFSLAVRPVHYPDTDLKSRNLTGPKNHSTKGAASSIVFLGFLTNPDRLLVRSPSKEGFFTMKKMLALLVIFILLLIPAAGDASFLILLKNGGRLTTPLYWIEGRMILFYYAGGIAGMERKEVERVEVFETGDPPGMALGDQEKTAPPSRAEKAEEPAAASEAKPAKPKLDLKEAKARKDRMTTELDVLAEKMREAGRAKDNEAKERYRQELRNMGTQIYELTDEVTEQNQGKLPDGWWGR